MFEDRDLNEPKYDLVDAVHLTGVELPHLKKWLGDFGLSSPDDRPAYKGHDEVLTLLTIMRARLAWKLIELGLGHHEACTAVKAWSGQDANVWLIALPNGWGRIIGAGEADKLLRDAGYIVRVTPVVAEVELAFKTPPKPPLVEAIGRAFRRLPTSTSPPWRR